MSKVQNLLDDRTNAIEDYHKARSCMSRLNCSVAKRKCEKQICKCVNDGGRDVLTTAYDNIPCKLFYS